MNTRHTSFLVLLGALGLSLAACDGDVLIEDGSSSSTGVTTSATSTGNSSTASGSTGSGVSTTSSSGVGGAGGAPSGTCEKMKSVTVSNLVLLDAGGDAVWTPGETAHFQVTLTNESAVDNFDYPGVAVSADFGGFQSSGNTLFGLFASQSVDLPFDVLADAEIPSGTVVNLTVDVTTIGAMCPDLDSLVGTFTLE